MRKCARNSRLWWPHLCWMVMAAVLAPLSASPDADSVPVARGQVMERLGEHFARITFEWPRSTYLTASVQDRVLTIHFDRIAHPDLGVMLKQMAPYIISAKVEDGGKTLKLTLDQPYRVRTFVSDTVNGVDILGIAPHTPVQEAAAPAAPEKKPEQKPVQKAEQKAEQKPLPKKLPFAMAKEEQTVPDKRHKAAAAPVSPVHVAKLNPAAGESSAASAASETVAAASVPEAASLKMLAGEQDGKTVLRFPWSERVAAASFMRNGYLWIVFSKPVPVDWSSLKESAASLFPTIAQLPDTHATVLRLRALDGIGATVQQEADSFEWRVVLTSPPEPPPLPLKLEVSTEPPLPPHVFAPALETAEPLSLTDPDIGDTLFVVPSYKAGQGVYPARRFVDFALLESAEGLAVVRIADDVLIARVHNGLRIGTQTGASLSSGTPTSALPQPAAAPSHAALVTLFPYDDWKPQDQPAVEKQLQALRLATAVADTAEDKLTAEIRLAQLELSIGLYAEALGVLHEVERTNPDYYVAHKLTALTAAADFMMARYNDAAQAFAGPELDGNEEISYWRAATNELLGNAQPAFDFLAYNGKYISHYPPNFRQRLGIVATDRAIEAGDYDVALKILDTLQKDSLLAGVQDYAQFLTARVAAGTGKLQDAVNTWAKQAADYSNPSVRAHAEFALLSAQMQAKAVAPDEAIDRLERLRLSWRGDALEMNALQLLGGLYMGKNDYVNAMSSWRDLTTQFPGTAPAIEADRKMREAFVELFDKGEVALLPPLTQLTMYYDYRDLIPTDESGDRIVGTLVDRLVSVDLLEQAASLLDQRMRFNYAREERSREGSKLARIYLMNHDPKKALKALENSVYGDNPQDLRDERDRLAAQAMVALSQYDEAIKLLADDKSFDADDIRLNAWWKQKDWPQVIAALEAAFKSRKAAEPLGPKDGEKVLMLATAYRAVGDTAQLQYLRDYFTPLMKDDAHAKLFAFLTQPDVPVTPDTFDAMMQQTEDAKTFLAGYKVDSNAAASGDAAPAAAPATATP